MSDHRALPHGRRAVGVALAAWVALLAVTLLAPSAAGPSWLVETIAAAGDAVGLPAALVAPERVEFLLNVVAFVPVSLFGGLLWTRATWRDWTAVGFAASLLVEVVQAVVLDGRSATHADVVANTLGALVGSLAAAGVLRVLARWSSERRADLPDGLPAAEQVEPPG